MPVERAAPSGSSLIDVLDRVLDKGIVIDAWVRVSLVGIDLITVEARVVVASIETYLQYAEAIRRTGTISRPPEMLPDEPAALGSGAPLPGAIGGQRTAQAGSSAGAGRHVSEAG